MIYRQINKVPEMSCHELFHNILKEDRGLLACRLEIRFRRHILRSFAYRKDIQKLFKFLL